MTTTRPQPRPLHTLHITEHQQILHYRLECYGVTDACRAWEECGCPESKSDENGDTWFDREGDTFAHGVEHLPGDWWRATDVCWPKISNEVPDAARELEHHGQPLGVGQYPVFTRYEGPEDEFLAFDLAWRVRVEGDLFHGKVPAGAIYVGNQAHGLARSPFANPWRVKEAFKSWTVEHRRAPRTPLAREATREQATARAVEFYRSYLEKDAQLRARAVEQLRGYALACWCKLPAKGQPDLCHAAVLAEIVNQPQPQLVTA